MATQAKAKSEGVVSRIRTFFDEVYVEMTKKVTWPTKEDLKAQTHVTLILLVVLAVIIFVYDKIFEVIILSLLNLVT